MKKNNLFLGNILNKLYKNFLKLNKIKNIENDNKDMFINIVDKKVFGLINRKKAVLTYPNLEITINDTIEKFDNSEFYITKDFIIHYRQFWPLGKIKQRIFLVHGFGACTVFFDKLIERLVSSGYYCLSLDLPGWGLSSKCSSYTQEERAKQITQLLTFINKKNSNDTKWIAIGHSMGGGCILNMDTNRIAKKIVFNPAVTPILNNLIGISHKYLIFLLNLFSSKRWFMDNIMAFVDETKIEEEMYTQILTQIPDSFTMVKTLLEGFDTSNMKERNENIPLYICVSDSDTVVGVKQNKVIKELMTLSKTKLTEVQGTHIYILNNLDDTFQYIMDSLND